MTFVSENLVRVEESINQACRRAARPRSEVQLMAVSKTHPCALLVEAFEAGHRLFGENRVQEFAEKSAELAALDLDAEIPQMHPESGPVETKPPGLQVRLIGHLQSNKAARAADLFSGIDTLDSLRLAVRLNQAAQRLGRVLPVLVEIKLSSEESKEGLAPDSDELQSLLDQLPDLTHLSPEGLMTIAPIDDDQSAARRCFRDLFLLREKLAQQHPRVALEQLSMGMSGDYAIAIEEGSTQVRIGTAIFGARPRTA